MQIFLSYLIICFYKLIEDLCDKEEKKKEEEGKKVTTTTTEAVVTIIIETIVTTIEVVTIWTKGGWGWGGGRGEWGRVITKRCNINDVRGGGKKEEVEKDKKRKKKKEKMEEENEKTKRIRGWRKRSNQDFYGQIITNEFWLLSVAELDQKF